jgi:hypothetical protein
MTKDNLKPELRKYSYDNLMTDALKQSQDNLVASGQRIGWAEALDFVKAEIVPILPWEYQIPVTETLDKKREQIESQK